MRSKNLETLISEIQELRFLVHFIPCIVLSSFLTQNAMAQTKPMHHHVTNPTLKEFEWLSNKTWSYFGTSALQKNIRKTEYKVKTLLKANEESKLRINSINHDNIQRNSIEERYLSYLKEHRQLFEHDWNEVLSLEQNSDDSYATMKIYLNRQQFAEQLLFNTSTLFSESIQSNLNEGDRKKCLAFSESLKTMSGAIAYYFNAYLIYYQVHKVEEKMLEAIKNDNFEQFSEYRQNLSITANQALNFADSLGPFVADRSLLISLKNALIFFKNEAGDNSNLIRNRFLQRKEYIQLKDSMDRKHNSKKTQEDVARYEEALTYYNKGVEMAENTLAELSSLRVSNRDAFNKASNIFIYKYIPRESK